MNSIILDYIQEEAIKHTKSFQLYQNTMELEYERNKRRISNPDSKQIKIPEHWSEDKKFNPFYVLKKRRQIAHAIDKKLNKGTYCPNPPHIRTIDKKGGGKRKICIYQIPDAAVSNYIYKRLLSKNKHRFSSLAYAYRNDRNAHYAIQDISLELKSHTRIFVSEFDFTDFFGSIDHKYLYKQLDENGFLISDFEKDIIKKFIDINDKGIPQGTSISLFLANLVCWKLDRRLEQEGLRFARYADDTVIWSNDYAKICRSVDIISDFSKETNIQINFKKSSGISLLSKSDIPSELSQTKEYIEFLGYKLSTDSVSIKDGSVKKIKKQISYILYRNLLQPIKVVPLKAVTIPNSHNNDPAFITAIMQIRRYLYGDLNEDKLTKYLNGAYKKLKFKGIMSYYPLIDNEDQLRSLDNWLIFSILNCLKKRRNILLKYGYNVSKYFPFTLNKSNILLTCKNKNINGKVGLIQIPSFLKIYKAIKKGIYSEGIEETMNPKSNNYNY
ncbi:DNA polymerase [Clostridium novyi A str. 4570]|uniref:DNA polymerase n=1 Tax=Clostridium novyi A str. 4570 TaxID=1444290 RepID=A0AA88ZUY2_CLONO|nr:reverse transcriptase domain-containing protein [Clostridium novyi]KGN03572.1 DNA polymerase [Clostridium novyi A str. 4570]